ncbi:MAG TPA: cysteine synthase family protein [Planctomycetota bacterium]|nr:cysteine synthase family protein [Planctomycetota bacterium]
MRLDTILDAIGNTPLVRLSRLPPPGTAEVWVKLEALNPGGSAKDRPARAMIEDAEKRGLLKPGATIVEPTGGNTGIGLALVSAVKGYKCVLVCPRGTSAEKIALMRAFGAEVIEARADVDPEHAEGYIGTAQRVAKERGAFHPDQFSNAANPRAHIESTAGEILRDLDGRLDVFVACVGSGGTLSGVGKALKEKLPGLKLVRVAPLSGTGAPGVARQPTAIEGVSAFEPDEAFGCPTIDEVAEVLDADAFATAKRMAREEGLLVGGSSGAAVAAALRIAGTLPEKARVVALCADTGRNYLGGFLR